MIVVDPNHDYKEEKTCVYKGEKYSVRDNGAVLRHSRKNGRKRQYDNNWFFGNLNKNTGYREIASKSIHRIVAVAFHGKPPTKERNIVDHIDINKQNNRPENLRWVTRLENIILNPVTVRKIEIVCNCNVEEFLANPKKYRDLLLNAPTNIQWMRAVSSLEGQACLENLTSWAKTDKPLSGGTIGEWIFNRRIANNNQEIEDVFKDIEQKTGINRKQLCNNNRKRNNYFEARKYAAKQLHSKLSLTDYEISNLLGIAAITVNQYLELTADWYSKDYTEVNDKQYKINSEKSDIIPSNIIQKNWGTQSEYPCCPQHAANNSLAKYAERLRENDVFFRNSFYSTIILKSAIIDKGKAILVLYRIEKNKDKSERWGIMRITYECEKYVHEIVKNYNNTLEHYWLKDVENHFKCIIEGRDWVPLYDSQGREFKGDYMPL